MGTQFQVATDSGFTTKLIDYSGAYETSHGVSVGTLTKGVTLYSRVRHSSVETGYSAWSPTRQFSIAIYQKRVIVLNAQYDCIPAINAVDSSGNIIWQKRIETTYHTTMRFKNLICKDSFNLVVFGNYLYNSYNHGIIMVIPCNGDIPDGTIASMSFINVNTLAFTLTDFTLTINTGTLASSDLTQVFDTITNTLTTSNYVTTVSGAY